MKKLFYSVVALLVVFVGVLAFGLFSLNPLVKKGVEHFGPKFLGAEVRLAESDLSILGGEGQLKGLFVGNPPGYKAESAIRADAIRMKMDMSTLTDSVVVIDAIVIESPQITYELAAKRSNLQTLVDTATRAAGGDTSGGGGAAGSTDAENEGRSVIIRNLIIRNGMVNMGTSALGGNVASVRLGDIHLRDIGAEGKTSMAEAVQEVLQVLNRSVLGVVTTLPSSLESTLKKGADAVNGTLKSVGESIKGLFE